MLPLYLGLIIAAPHLLLAWMGEAPSDTVAVLRLMCGAMAVAALGGGSEQVLWGHGEARKVFWVSMAALAANLAVTFFAMHRIGLQGAAWGFLLSMTVRSMAFLVLASHMGQTGAFSVLRGSLKGVFLPATACGAVTWGVLTLAWPGGWLGMIAASLAGGMAYGAGLHFGGARPEERMLAREVLLSPITLVRFAWHSLRRLQHRIGPKYRAYIFLANIYRVLTYNPERVTARLEELFATKEDPYNAFEPESQERYSYELAMLDAVRGRAKFERAVEVGCAEGVFTELLAPRCEALVALDNSLIALDRARKRCRRFESVEFGKYDMRRDPLPGTYDLIVVVALGNLVLPKEFRRVCAAIVDALRPGGYLLVGELRGPEIFQNSWWAKRLFLGGKWILEHIGEDPNLKKVGDYNLDLWMHTLFRKVQPNVSA